MMGSYVSRHPKVSLIIALALYCIPAFWIQPAIDDWNTTRPIFDFDAVLLLPGLFWRPLEQLMKWAAGLNVASHLWIFHGVAVFGHVGGTILLYRILCRVQKNGGSAVSGALFFAVTPAVSAAVWSMDSAIQTCSTGFGLAAVWFMISRPSCFGAMLGFGSAAVASLWKESGLAWFLAAPIFAAALDSKSSQTQGIFLTFKLLRIGAGLCGAAVYFTVRMALSTTAGLGGETGRYALNWDPLIWTKNAAMLLGVSCTTTDTVSLFGTGNLEWAALSFVGVLPLLVWIIVRGKRRIGTVGFWLGMSAVAALIAPHIVLGHVSEMYAHPVIAGIVLWFVGVLHVGERVGPFSRFFYGVAIVFCLAVSTHKWIAMYHTGLRAKGVGIKILEHYGTPDSIPLQVCTLVQDKPRRAGYSVFLAFPPSASNNGRSIWGETEWRKPRQIWTIEDRDDCPQSELDVWLVHPDGKFEVLRHP